MDSIIINRRTPEDYTLDDIIELNYNLANNNIDLIQSKIESLHVKTRRGVLDFLNAIRPDKNSIQVNDFSIQWKITPSIKFNNLFEGHIKDGLENSSISVHIKKETSSSVELYLTIDSKSFKIRDDGNIDTLDSIIGGSLKF